MYSNIFKGFQILYTKIYSRVWFKFCYICKKNLYYIILANTLGLITTFLSAPLFLCYILLLFFCLYKMLWNCWEIFFSSFCLFFSLVVLVRTFSSIYVHFYFIFLVSKIYGRLRQIFRPSLIFGFFILKMKSINSTSIIKLLCYIVYFILMF